jgi:hypothetical protein
VLLIGRKKKVEKVNGGNNSTNLKNTNLDRRAIHIHGGIEHNLVEKPNTTPVETQKFKRV